jgi:hypothetical protein
MQSNSELRNPTNTTGRIDEDVNSGILSSQSGGKPLPGDVKSFMESRFKTDFSQIRVHTDNNAVQLSRQLQAQAFTVGKDIFLTRGNFHPVRLKEHSYWPMNLPILYNRKAYKSILFLYQSNVFNIQVITK